jgi:hypothetical protein
MPPRSLDPYLEVAIDIARGLGASTTLLDRLSSCRGRAASLLEWPEMADWLWTEKKSDLTRLAQAFYHLLDRDGLAYVTDPGDFPENVPANLFSCAEHHGFRWEPKDFHARLESKEIQFRLIGPDGSQAETTLRTPEGIVRMDADDVLLPLLKMIRKTSLGAFEIPIVSEQRWFVITPKAAWKTLERRYGDRWATFSSMDSDWGAADPTVPPK